MADQHGERGDDAGVPVADQLPGPGDPDEQGGTAGECRAPLPGTIARVLVTMGDLVNDGDPLVVLEAMKMEHTLRATGTGTVGDVRCAPGDQVDVGDVLVVLEPA